MNRYQLATLVKWAGTLRTRKRLQKVAFLLQAAGCDLDLEYSLHHYGPYSHDLARQTDLMVSAGLLREEREQNAVKGASFSYELSESAVSQLASCQALERRLSGLAGREKLAKRLLDSGLRELELASTIAFFRTRQPPYQWEDARQAAAEFKNEQPDGSAMLQAERLAQEVVEGE